MPFANPDATFAQQAERVFAFYQQAVDIREKHAAGDNDTRRVSLNNIAMAANAATSALRLMHWAKHGGEGLLIQALGLAKPEYINPVADDLLRASRLFLLLESQFQMETAFRNILLALGQPATRQGFHNVADAVLKAVAVADPDLKLRVLNVPALLRNSMHANGVHHGWKGTDTVETIEGAEFRFQHGKRVQCGSWYHIVTALSASLEIVDAVFSSAVIQKLANIPDVYAEQKAAEGP